MSAPSFTFLAYARTGFAASITAPDASTGPARLPLPLTLSVDGAKAGGSATVDVPGELLGPGDVEALDPAQIIRREPMPGDRGFPPHLFPFVEFDRADYPWLFSPFAPAADRLRPWLALVVVERRVEVALDEQALPLPTVTITGIAAGQLLDLTPAWAWAHVQALGDVQPADLGTLERAHPERVASRLMAPRRLRPFTDYYACLVPAFAAGVDAGLGREPTKTLAPAWIAGAATVTLPLLDHWEFSTGQAGDFASLAQRMKAIVAPGAVSGRALDASHPGGSLPSAGATMQLGGALRPAGAAAPHAAAASFVTGLTKRLNAGAPTAGAAAPHLVLAPPIYGSWAAGRATVPPAKRGAKPTPLGPTDAHPPWLRELNVHPRHRAVAALGARIVQEHQEDLMAEAWRQVGSLQQANDLLRRAQLARSAANVIHGRLSRLPAADLLAVLAPAAARLPVTVGGVRWTLGARVRASRIPPRLLGPAVRRAARPRGPVARRFGQHGVAALLARVNSGQLTSAGARPVPHGTQLLDGRGGIAPTAVAAIDPTRELRLTVDGQLGAWTRPDRYLAAALDAQTALQQVLTLADPPAHPALDALVDSAAGNVTSLAAPRTAVLATLNPEATAVARTHARLAGVPAGRPVEDALEPLRFTPSFPAPLFDVVRRFGEQYVMPGLDALPADSVTGVEVDDRFVNALLVGANHEMSRELLWRGFPADLRGTSFTFFWDTKGRVPALNEVTPPDLRDITPIAEWPTTRKLDAGPPTAAAGRFVVVVRAELLRRFPGTVVHLAQALPATASTPREPGPIERYPAFQGRVGEDVAFYAFDLPAADARANPGWFVVFRQQPGEPRFGLVEALDGQVGGAPASWQLLSWAHLATTPQELHDMVYAPALAPATATPANATGAAWGTHAADIADIALQDPVRVAIHAGDMIPPS